MAAAPLAQSIQLGHFWFVPPSLCHLSSFTFLLLCKDGGPSGWIRCLGRRPNPPTPRMFDQGCGVQGPVPWAKCRSELRLKGLRPRRLLFGAGRGRLPARAARRTPGQQSLRGNALHFVRAPATGAVLPDRFSARGQICGARRAAGPGLTSTICHRQVTCKSS